MPLPDRQAPAVPDYLPLVRDVVLRAADGIDCTVVLFGSRAAGAQRRGSDIDVGFIGVGGELFTRLRDQILGELEESVVPHRIDLVNMDTVSSDFREFALQKVVVWKQNSHAN